MECQNEGVDVGLKLRECVSKAHLRSMFKMALCHKTSFTKAKKLSVES